MKADVAPGLVAGRRILLADADAAIRKAAHQLLARVSCEVDTAKDGAEALKLCRSRKYDVVMGDIRLPDMSGYEFFAQAREASGNVPIVLLTGFGYDPTHSIVRARQEGLRAVLYKPFRLDRLCEAIEDALDPNRAARGGLHPRLLAK
jgi:DNA-binding NtrC family response regulator